MKLYRIGKVTNACIFCGHSITTNKTLEKGYGDVCAKNHATRIKQMNAIGKLLGNSIITGSSDAVRNGMKIQELVQLSAEAMAQMTFIDCKPYIPANQIVIEDEDQIAMKDEDEMPLEEIFTRSKKAKLFM